MRTCTSVASSVLVCVFFHWSSSFSTFKSHKAMRVLHAQLIPVTLFYICLLLWMVQTCGHTFHLCFLLVCIGMW
uniref:Uncharacterized protein n=1 Tax=Ixodes ricinus TaxID=34613 RepID=A0A6B0U1Q3_IXORI